MKEKELEFNRIVKANKAAIFTVCYLFSKDQDDVNDLFQEKHQNIFYFFVIKHQFRCLNGCNLIEL